MTNPGWGGGATDPIRPNRCASAIQIALPHFPAIVVDVRRARTASARRRWDTNVLTV